MFRRTIDKLYKVVVGKERNFQYQSRKINFFNLFLQKKNYLTKLNEWYLSCFRIIVWKKAKFKELIRLLEPLHHPVWRFLHHWTSNWLVEKQMLLPYSSSLVLFWSHLDFFWFKVRLVIRKAPSKQLSMLLKKLRIKPWASGEELVWEPRPGAVHQPTTRRLVGGFTMNATIKSCKLSTAGFQGKARLADFLWRLG